MPKDNEAATWREKLDQLYKSSSQSFRVVVHGSKVGTSYFYISVLHNGCYNKSLHDLLVIFLLYRNLYLDFLKEF